jgi:hypothetical protein
MADDPAPESEPPPADPAVREELDRMEEEREIPDTDSGEGDAEDDLPVEGEADSGEEAPTG